MTKVVPIVMAVATAAAGIVADPPRPQQHGWWSQYAEAPTTAMVEYHHFDRQGIAGFIAVPDCKKVGAYAWIRVNHGPWERVRVFDCLGSDGDPEWWRHNNVLGELGYNLAAKYGIVGRGGVSAVLAWE